MRELLCIFIFATSIANAQYTVKGTMSSPEKSRWVILYKIEGASQKFISNATIKLETVAVGNAKQVLGKFKFDLPDTAKPGVYRVTYKNTGNGFVDFFFNKENVEFIFNPKYPDQSAVFTYSRENKLFKEYQEAYNLVQNNIDNYQIAYIDKGNKNDRKAYKKELKKLEDIQESYENKSEGMLVYSFIKASQRYNSSRAIDKKEEYLKAISNNFFNNIDFSSNVLYNSSFLIDKISEYVFYLSYSEDANLQQKLLKESIKTVMDKIPSGKFRKAAVSFLITTLTVKLNGEAVDWMLAEYYDKLPEYQKDVKFKAEVLKALRATVGRIAPDFSWKEGNSEIKLSTLNDGEKYLLVFWSTGCPHCVKDIPKLSKFTQNLKNVSVISFGIENNEDIEIWAEFVKKLPNWHNAIGTHPEHKFNNETVQMYNLLGTPTYFVLDKNKRIIAMPNQLQDVEEYFKNN